MRGVMKMSGQSRFALLIVAAVAAVAILWYRGQVYEDQTAGVQPKLVILTGGDGPYWKLMASGAREAARDLDAEVQLMMPEGDDDLSRQTQLLSSLKCDGIDGVAISPLDAEKQTRLINGLCDSVVVVTVDSDAPLSNRTSYIGANNFAAGAQCGEAVIEAMSDGGKLVVCLANLTKDNMLERKRGMEEKLTRNQPGEGDEPRASYEIVDWLVDNGDRDKARQQLIEFLEEHDDIDCVVGLNAFHGGEMLAAVEQAGSEDMKIVAFDTEDVTLEGVENGKIFATVAQDPYQYGSASVRQLAYLCRHNEDGRPPLGVQSTLTIGTKVLRQQDIEQFRKTFDKQQNATPSST